MREELRRQFEHPEADKHSFPFWGWNSRLDREEIRTQIREMKQAGVGGFFIHSRDGLETEYMGEEWLECVKTAVAEAKKQGLYAWLYDEDRWPSGTAGGRVTSCGDEYRCKGLTMEVLSASEYDRLYGEEIQPKSAAGFSDTRNGLLAVWRASVDGDTVRWYERLPLQKNETLAEGEVLLVVRLEVSAPSEWFNHEAPPDNLNPDCVRKFIAETHECYKRAVGEEFGKTIPGIFTDEPSLNDRHAYFGETKSWIPWTYGYQEYFKALVGYDFFEYLPEFYFHASHSPRVRHDYWYSIARRYGESYFKVIGEWCEQNHLFFTGHFLQEDKLGTSTRVNGAIMPNYQYQHVPGIDMLCEQTNEYLTVKQCTSVASQLGKKQVISETYGCTGWEFTFEGQKWMGDWQFVLGVNRRCQHLALYSLRGCRKRDYPPSFHYNTTWWKENKTVDDYFARLSVMLEQGEAVRDILLLHPLTTGWTRMGVNPYGNPVRRLERDTPVLNEIGEDFNRLIEYLERQHLDCDLGDELLLDKYGSVREGQLIVGRAAYHAVVLPPVESLLESTCERLLEYMNQGGLVYALQSVPYMVAGSEEAWQQYKALTEHKNWIAADTREELAGKLERYRTVWIRENEGAASPSAGECTDILYQLRKTGEDYILFLVNNNREQTRQMTVRLPFYARPWRMDPLSGEIEELTASGGSDVAVTEFIQELAPTGSALYYLITAAAEEQRQPCGVTASVFSYRLDHENVLPLDICRYRIDGGDWSEPMEVWQAQLQLREQLGMRQIHRNGLEQRYKWVGCPHPADGHRTELSFVFEAKEEIKGASLVLERLAEFSAALNGKTVNTEKNGWFLDRELEACALPELRAGKNTLVISCAYRNDMELENCYITGDFGVDRDRRIGRLPDVLTVGDWTEQGLKHYCGNVIYLLEYEYQPDRYGNAPEVKLWLPEIKAVYVKITVNGHERVLPWNFTQAVAISDWLVCGKNEIEVEVAASPRNMMGPFHLKQKPYNTNDAAFSPSEASYSAEYLLASYGIFGEMKIE